MNKSDTAAAVLVGLVVLGGGGLALAATRKKGTPAGAAPPSPKSDADALIRRANQKAALAWATDFANDPIGVSPLAAGALARWAGIESSGNATAKSRLDERGLLQVGPHAVSERQATPQEWAMLIDPKTTRAQHTFIAIKYADALAKRAIAHLGGEVDDPVDRIWYAKLYHQRPVDVRDVVGPLTKQLSTTSARTIAAALAAAWANDPKALHRLRAANVVAWGTAS